MITISETIYRLTVKGNMKMLTSQDSFTTVGEYKLSEIDSGKLPLDSNEYILEELNVALTEYFNPMTMQIMEYVNRLASIYKRQHLVIGPKRKIDEIRNLEEIRKRWEALKKELMLINPVSAFEIVRGKDKEMHDILLIKENLETTHFMNLFLYIHGYKDLKEQTKYSEQREERDKLGIGFYVPTQLTFAKETTIEAREIYTKAILNPNKKIDKSLISKVTGQDNLSINHLTKGLFKKDEHHHLHYAELEAFEQIHEDYKTDLFLKLETIEHKTYG